MAYTGEGTAWHRHRRLRQRITLVVILLLLLSAGAVAVAFYQGLIGVPDDGASVAAPPPCPTGKAKATTSLAPSAVTVNVYNATSRDGLAGDVAGQLRKRSFGIGKVANDPRNTSPKGTAVVRYGAKGKAAAALVAAQVPKAARKADKRKSATVDLVIGAAFRELAPSAKPTPTPTPTPTPSATRCTTPPSPTSPGKPAPSPATTHSKK